MTKRIVALFLVLMVVLMLLFGVSAVDGLTLFIAIGIASGCWLWALIICQVVRDLPPGRGA